MSVPSSNPLYQTLRPIRHVDAVSTINVILVAKGVGVTLHDPIDQWGTRHGGWGSPRATKYGGSPWADGVNIIFLLVRRR